MEQCIASRCELAGRSRGAATPSRRTAARLWMAVLVWALVAPVLVCAGLCLSVLGAVFLGIWFLAWVLVYLGSHFVRRVFGRGTPRAARDDSVEAVLDELEAGRLSPARAIRRLSRRQGAGGRHLITLLCAEVRTDGMSFALWLPYLPLMALLMGLEFIGTPVGVRPRRPVRLDWRKRTLRAILADLPVLPVSRLLMVLLRSGPHFETGAGQFFARFSIG